MGRKLKGKAKRNSKVATGMATDESSVTNVSPVEAGEEDRIWFDSSPTLDGKVTLLTLPDTPEKPLSKKSKRDESVSHAVPSKGNEDVLAAIRKLSLKHDASFQKISVIEKTTHATSRELESLSVTVKQLVSDVGENKKELCRLRNEIQRLQKDNGTLKTALNESRRYNWRSFLKLHGLKEQEGEDVRQRVIEVLQQVAPTFSASLDAGVDVVHRLGPKAGKCRSVIILFSLRRVRDAIWQAARKCRFLRDSKLTITEPVPPEDRAAREKLWPLVLKARQDGKKASFRSSYALIDGKRFDYAETNEC